MARVSVFALLLLSCVRSGASVAQCTIKIGGMLRAGTEKFNAYDKAAKAAFTMAKDWAVDHSKSYYLDLSHIKAYDSATMATEIGKMTDPLSAATLVDVLVCPYASTVSSLCVQAVKATFRGVIIVWGGADDSIPTTHCVAKNCIVTFTPASKYAISGLEAFDAKSTSALQVALITNNSPFSRSIKSGAKNAIAAMGPTKMVVQSTVDLSVYAAAPTSIDRAKVTQAMLKNPDVVVLMGHNGDVENVIVEIGKFGHYPRALLATNSLGSSATANFGEYSQYQRCVVMPSQWNSASTNTDPVVGWTSTSFTKGLKDKGHTASYHSASAGGAAVALINALEALSITAATCSNRVNLYTKMKALDIQSFYGQLKFSSTGAIEKHMFMEQSFPGNFVTHATVAYPLSGKGCWGSEVVSSGARAPGARAATAAAGLALLLSTGGGQ